MMELAKLFMNRFSSTEYDIIAFLNASLLSNGLFVFKS